MDNGDRILQEIIVKKKEQEGAIFSSYLSKKEVGSKLMTALKTRFNEGGEGLSRPGFYLSDSDNKTGLLCDLTGLSSLILIDEFDKNLKALSASALSKKAAAFTKSLNASLQGAVNSLHRYENGTLRFGARPYYRDEVRGESGPIVVDAYVEAVAKTAAVFSKLRRLMLRYEAAGNPLKIELTLYDQPVKDVLGLIEEIIAKSIKKLNEAAIRDERGEAFSVGGRSLAEINNRHTAETYGIDLAKAEELNQEDNKKYINIAKGWNFAPVSDHKNTQPSLYFTFVVVDAYLMIKEANEEAVAKLSEYDAAKKAELTLKKLYRESGEPPVKPDASKDKDIKFLLSIWDDFLLLKTNCIYAGRYLDNMLTENGVDLSVDFVGAGFEPFAPDTLSKSRSSNAMIDTLYSISIMIGSGLDLDYEAVGELDIFFEKMQYALQNIQRMYKMLSDSGRLYIVERHILNFDEDMDASLKAEADILRKRGILAMTLVPIMVTAFSAVSKYLIRYPQREMQNYLKYLLANRRKDAEGAYEWLWDADEYNVHINYYYLTALQGFYEYYERYELPFSDNAKEYAAKLSEVKNEYENRMETERRLFEIEKQQIEEEKKKVEDELTKAKNLKAPIEETLENLIHDYLDREGVRIFNSLMQDIIMQNSEAVQKKKQAMADGDSLAKAVLQEDSAAAMFRKAFLSNFDEVFESVVGKQGEEGKMFHYDQYDMPKIMRREITYADTAAYKEATQNAYAAMLKEFARVTGFSDIGKSED